MYIRRCGKVHILHLCVTPMLSVGGNCLLIHVLGIVLNCISVASMILKQFLMINDRQEGRHHLDKIINFIKTLSITLRTYYFIEHATARPGGI